jgi:hypothetical protein
MYVFKRYFNKPIIWDKNMPSHAFNIYILHYPIVHIFQALFLEAVSVPYSIKFIIVTIVSLVLSYVFSKFVMKPYPKIAVSIGIIGTLLLFVIA